MSELATKAPAFSKIKALREDNMKSHEVENLVRELSVLDSTLAARKLEDLDSETVVQVLRAMNPTNVDTIIQHIDPQKIEAFLNKIPAHIRSQWEMNRSYPENTVGRMMEPPLAVLDSELTVNEAKSILREIVRTEFVTYGYVVDASQKLVGVLVMRDLLFAEGNERLHEIMVRNPFSIRPEQDLMEVMKEVVVHHYPVYPVCDKSGKIVGLIRGHRLFENQAFEIIAQAGSMVGVDREEQISTPWQRSFRFRHPWLQLNLLTAFVAGAVVSLFQNTIDQVVVLAAFLPVLAGQSGNTGCQALAVTLRGMTLGELTPATARKAISKEAFLGFLNGAFVGISAGIGMYLLARYQGNPNAAILGVIVVFAMIGSCMISGISGATVPLALKRLGADPATASSIFLTTATDVASMGMLLGLATWILL